MKKKVLTLLLALTMTSALITGCGGNSDAGEEKKAEEGNTEEKAEEKDEEKDEEKELTAWLDEAVKQYEAEALRGCTQEATSSYDDGSTEVTKYVKTVDDEKKIVMSKYEYTTNTQTDFYTQEDGKDYWYAEGYNENGEPIMLKIESTEEYNTYAGMAAEPKFLAESTDEIEVVEQTVTNAGEEDGMIKIQIDEKLKYHMSDGDITRESVLDDCGWTEEDLAYLEGISEAIDAYVKETNEENKVIEETVYDVSETVWITADGHKLVKSESEQSSFNTGNGEAAMAFYNMRWKLDGIKSMLAEGISLEEARQTADEQYSTDESGPSRIYTGVTRVTTYVTGGDCVPLEELPADAKEITEEQYYNGEY